MEIFDNVIAQVDDYPLSMEEGRCMRQDFKTERERFCEQHTQAMERYEEWDFEGGPGAGGEGDE